MKIPSLRPLTQISQEWLVAPAAEAAAGENGSRENWLPQITYGFRED